ncbi:MAG: glucosamine-6-phosphate deaminase [Thermomicrobiales bacterium]|nr:glucosamine-6-phosphate deaminase [Thermomicrobiales bacterium]
MTALNEFNADSLRVRVFPDRESLGATAADEASAALIDLIDRTGHATVLFAAAPSQNEFLAAIASNPAIDWRKVTAFQLDEYVGLSADHSAGFGNFLNRSIFARANPGTVHLIGETTSLAAAEERCRAYAELLVVSPPDIAFIGIGENGHLAFNDPPVADFHDPLSVKVVELDDACRQQQVNDGCFPDFDAVPTHAITLTIPTLMSAARLFCMVPGPTKRAAVAATLRGPIATNCPASILRTHPNCTLYLDRESFGDG